jgi:predicted MPP superfamily phosphohydrolase
MSLATLQQNVIHSDTVIPAPLSAWKAQFHARLNVIARSRLAHQAFAALLICGAPGLGAYVYCIEPTWLKVRRLTLRIHQLPSSLDGLRIVQLSDLHMGSTIPSWFLQKVVKTTQTLAPDLIVLTGDYVHTHPDNVTELTTLLRQLHAPTGVFAVLGNHDYGVNYAGDSGISGVETLVISALEQAGVTVLRNQWLPIGRGQHPLALVGLDEFWSGRTRLAPFQTVPTTMPRLVLSHNPDVIPFLPENSFDVLLCGHTHGGQIRIPPFRPPITATRNRQYWGGLFSLGRGQAYISNGIGYTWRARFATRPECVCITLAGSK